MAGVRPEQAEQFYEEDEDPARVLGIFDAADKRRTARPAKIAVWVVELRNGLATALRHAADIIESSRTGVR